VSWKARRVKTTSHQNHYVEETALDIGFGRQPPSSAALAMEETKWNNYLTLRDPPRRRPKSEELGSSIYRGIVPAKSILRRDIAVNGAIVSFFGYSENSNL
jgi:dimethylaniline monooxygenase (N-oxide forming)